MIEPIQQNEPHPITTEVCGVCWQPWGEHMKLAVDYGDDDDDYAEVTYGPVTLEHCIVLLKRANQGPPGPVGPMGPMGVSTP